MTPEETLASLFYLGPGTEVQAAISAQKLLAKLGEVGLHVVAEGHAVIDGQVVALCARCDHDTWLHSFTGSGRCIPECGCRRFVSPVAGADETEAPK